MTISGTTVSIGAILGLLVLIFSVMILVLKLMGIFPLESPDTILFVFTALLGLARIT